MNPFDSPGLMTDALASKLRPPSFFKERGNRWIVAQAQNGRSTKPVDLKAFKDADFLTGVWGVTYTPEEEGVAMSQGDVFRADGAALAQQAIDTGADLLIMDAEECLKGADPSPLIATCARFAGPKALSTLGAASGNNVYPIDYGQFIDAGWDIIAQAYTATSTDYRPRNCIDHILRWCARPWRVNGDTSPFDSALMLRHFHITVDSSSESRPKAEGGIGRPQTAEEIVADIIAAQITSEDISVFMAEFGLDHFYDVLKEVTVRLVPKTPTDTRVAMLELGTAQEARWTKGGLSKSTIASSRIGLADALLQLTDSKLKDRLAAIKAAIGVSA